jgi:hypothetical protein
MLLVLPSIATRIILSRCLSFYATRKNIEYEWKGFCKLIDNYNIVAFYIRVFKVSLFIFYHREAVALDMYW